MFSVRQILTLASFALTITAAVAVAFRAGGNKSQNMATHEGRRRTCISAFTRRAAER